MIYQIKENLNRKQINIFNDHHTPRVNILLNCLDGLNVCL